MKWTGNTASTFAGGDGTDKRPFKISNGEELAYLAHKVNSGIDFNKCFFVLTNNIDLNNVEWIPIGSGFTPKKKYEYSDYSKIIHVDNSFRGTFDGNGNVIYNLNITECKNKAIGLFGFVDGATLMNIKIEDASVLSTEWESDAGGLVGYSFDSEIRNSYSVSKINIHGKEYGKEYFSFAGCIVGYTNRGGEIINCLGKGEVFGNHKGNIVGCFDPPKLVNNYSDNSSGDAADSKNGARRIISSNNQVQLFEEPFVHWDFNTIWKFTEESTFPIFQPSISQFNLSICNEDYLYKIMMLQMQLKYDSVGNFDDNGIALISSKKKYGLLNLEGKELVPCEYDYMGKFSDEGIAIVQKNGKWGFIDKNISDKVEDILIQEYDSSYKNIESLSDNRLLAEEYNGRENTMYYLLNEKGEKILPPIFDKIIWISATICMVKIGEKYGCYDESGKELIPVIYDKILKHKHSDSYTVLNNQDKGVFSFDGSLIIPVEYESVIPIGSKSYLVKNHDEQWGMYCEDKGIVLDCIYDKMLLSTKLLYDVETVRVFKNDKCGLFSIEGIELIPMQYENIFDWNDGNLYSAKKDGYWGFLDKKTLVMKTDFLYDRISTYITKSYLAEREKCWILVNNEGVEIETNVKSIVVNDGWGKTTIYEVDNNGKLTQKSSYDECDDDYGYSHSELDNMYRGAFDGIEDAYWNID